MPNFVRLKKGEDRRIRAGHPWIYSNEIDTAATPLKNYSPGEEVLIEAQDKSILGIGYINPHSLIAVRILAKEPQPLTHDFFVKQIRNSLSIREKLFSQPYYRLVFSEADFLSGLIIDRFADDFVVQINTAGMELKIEFIMSALRKIFPTLNSILLRNDSQIRTQEGLETYIQAGFGQPPEDLILVENNVQFSIPLWHGQKTGWFYDHRLNRARLHQYVKNQRVLDVFSYVGGWGIQAAVFGAKQVDCIESSERACQFIASNAALNQVQDKVTTICDDAFDAMKNLLQANKTYDVIVLDPPAFIKKFKDKKEGIVAYQRINELALKLLTTDGILISCSCSMHLGMDDMLALLQRSAYRAQTTIQLLERGHQGPDHPMHMAIPESDYLKVIVLRKMS